MITSLISSSDNIAKFLLSLALSISEMTLAVMRSSWAWVSSDTWQTLSTISWMSRYARFCLGNQYFVQIKLMLLHVLERLPRSAIWLQICKHSFSLLRLWWKNFRNLMCSCDSIDNSLHNKLSNLQWVLKGMPNTRRTHFPQAVNNLSIYGLEKSQRTQP